MDPVTLAASKSYAARIAPGVRFQHINRHSGRGGGLISVQFDDGYEDVFLNAFPVMEHYGFRGSVFMVTDLIGADGGTWQSKFLSAQQLLDLEEAGWEIGSHSKTHADFTTLTEEQMDDEYRLSKEALLSIGLKSVNSFAYPYGKRNDLSDIVGAKYYDRLRVTGSPVTVSWNENGALVPGAIWNDSNTDVDLRRLKQLCLNSVVNGDDLCLYFHHVHDGGSSGWIDKNRFAALMEYIHTIGGRVVPLREIMAPYNLLVIADGQFNTLDGWVITGTAISNETGSAELTDDDAYVGDNSLKLVGKSNIGTQFIEVRTEVGVAPAVWPRRKVRVSARVKINNALTPNYSGAGFRFGYRFYRDYLGGHGVGDFTKSIVGPTDGWEVVSVEADVPDNARLIVPRIRLDGAVGEVLVDHVIVTYTDWGDVG